MTHTRSSRGVSRALLAIGAAACALIVFVPRETQAEEISDSERSGEYDEGGARFGDVVVKGELKPTASGWVLLRTYENTSDEPRSFDVEERVLRTETMHTARVSPPPVAILQRHQVLKLAAHEKRAIGVTLPASISAQMDASARIQSSVQHALARSAEDGTLDYRMIQQRYMAFHVDYLKPLPPGATRAPDPDNGVTAPAAIGMEPRPAGNLGRGLSGF